MTPSFEPTDATATVTPTCPACAGSSLRRRYRLAYGSVWQCPRCGSAVTQFSDPEALARANTQWGDVAHVRSRRLLEPEERRQARARLQTLRPWRADGQLLEIGPSRGEFLAAALAAGFSVSAADLFDVLAPEIRSRCTAVYTGDFLECAIEARFDTVAAFHVLEHVPDPRGFLERSRDLLRPGGYLALEVPNFNALDRRVTGSRWDMLFDYHVSHFSRRGLVRLIESVGLSVCHAASTSDASRYLAGPYFRARVAAWTALKRAVRPQPPERARREAPATAVDRGEGIAAAVVRTEYMALRLLSVPFVPFAKVQAWLGCGQVIRLIARRA